MATMTNIPRLTVPAPGGAGDDWVVPDGDETYRLVVSGIKGPRNKQFQGKVDPDKLQVRLEFRVEDPTNAFHGVTWLQWVGLSLHEKAAMRHLLVAIEGGEDPFGAGDDVDLADYLNRPFRGYVEVDAVPARDDPGRTLRFAKVTKFSPAKKQAKPAPPPPPADEDEDGEDPFAS